MNTGPWTPLHYVSTISLSSPGNQEFISFDVGISVSVACLPEKYGLHEPFIAASLRSMNL